MAKARSATEVIGSVNPAVGLFCVGRKSTLFNYINLDATKPTDGPPFRELKFPGDPFSYWIQQSCNGLLLCCSFVNYDRWFSELPTHSCYVYNPTTRCFARLPRPGVTDGVPRKVHGINLAFDPSKSPVYKVVCVRDSGLNRDPQPFRVDVYSSESCVWRACGAPFLDRARFGHGVYWNDSIHWINYQTKELLYFNVNNEKIGKISLPATISGCGESRRRSITYFGESGGHLHIVESCDAQMAFSVYEMRWDYSEWFVRYRVDLTVAATYFPDRTNASFPETETGANKLVSMISSHSALYETTDVMELENRTRWRYTVLCLVRADEVEGRHSFLVLHASGRVLQFDLDCDTFEQVVGIGDAVVESWLPDAFREIYFAGAFEKIELPHAFEHIESIAGV